MQTLCSQCQTPMTCNPEGGGWCADLPHLIPVPEPRTKTCLCRACLIKKLSQKPKP
jgi:hypothetical protein